MSAGDAVLHAATLTAARLLRLIDRIEHAAIGEMRLLRLGPATKRVIDGVKLDLRELLRQRSGNCRRTRPIEIARRDLLTFLAIQILEVSLSELARAMAINPAVLLMDEPFGALDAQTREFMQEELLRILENEKKTMLFVTHSIDESIVLGDRIVVMARRPGRIKEILPVDIPRPRKILSVRAHPQYIELRNSIWEMLKQDLSQETPGENVHEPAR